MTKSSSKNAKTAESASVLDSSLSVAEVQSAPDTIRILVIDDEPQEYAIIKQYLKKAVTPKYVIEWEGNAEDAIAKIKTKQHDLYLLDQNLGALSGLEVLRQIDAHDFPHPIIIVTGASDSKIDHQALDLGASDFLVKGEFNATLLDRTLRYAIERKQREIEAITLSEDLTLALEKSHSLASDLARSQKKLSLLAYTDALTGVANRASFQERLEYEISISVREKAQFAIIYFDLDGFKAVNDTLGHAAGDTVLQEVAKRVKDVLRDSDTFARIGGDEFAIILREITSNHVVKVAQKILKTLQHACPISEKHEVTIGASIGASMFPSDGNTVDTLVRRADNAMYAAKQSGKNAYKLFSMKFEREALEQHTLEQEMLSSLKQNHFVMHYQPLVDSRSDVVVGAEALIRWEHPTKGRIPPLDFIPLAEHTGIILEMGKWILNQACADMRCWLDEQRTIERVYVNVSPKQLLDASFTQVIEEALKKHNLKPQHLGIEITEGCVFESPEVTHLILDDLSAMGIHISIDDFGTGFSSLSRLKNFPINCIKIDRSFVSDAHENQDSFKIVCAILAMAQVLELSVIAEGVENQVQVDMLKTMQCDTLQGYFLGRPSPMESVY